VRHGNRYSERIFHRFSPLVEFVDGHAVCRTVEMAVHNQACVVVSDEDEVGQMQNVFVGNLTWLFPSMSYGGIDLFQRVCHLCSFIQRGQK
jgi:hypothetical protein